MGKVLVRGKGVFDLDGVLARKDLTAVDKIVLLGLVRFYKLKMNCTQSTLAKAVGITLKSINISIHRLEDLNILTSSNTYHFNDYIILLSEVTTMKKSKIQEAVIRKFAPVAFIKSDKEYNPAEVILPKRGTERSAGYDFVAPCDIAIPARGRTKVIPFNVKVHLMKYEYLACMVRSSLGVKFGVMLAQGTAVIDSDYADNPDNDGNIGFAFVNNSDKDYVIKKGERCVQGIISKYLCVNDDSASGERAGGYGSTGK